METMTNANKQEIAAMVRQELDRRGWAEGRARARRRHRTPAAGTRWEHRTRDGGAATCVKTADGYRYGRRVYASLSGAAVAAAEALGLNTTSINGWVFWKRVTVH